MVSELSNASTLTEDWRLQATIPELGSANSESGPNAKMDRSSITPAEACATMPRKALDGNANVQYAVGPTGAGHWMRPKISVRKIGGIKPRIYFRCRFCRSRLVVPHEFAGLKAECPKCRSMSQVPQQCAEEHTDVPFPVLTMTHG